MYNIWLLEFFWTIFVQGQLQIINGSSLAFIGINSQPIFSGYFETITYFYLGLFAITSFVFIIAFLIKFIAISGNMNEISIKEKLIHTAKRFGSTLLILITLPLIMYILTIVLDFSLGRLFIDTNIISSDGHDTFMYQLYTIGIENLPTNAIDVTHFGPPSSQYIENYNYFVQFIVVNAIMFSYLYLMWTYFQKLIEIFILYITAPFAGVFAFSDDDLKVKLWMKEIKNKLISMLMVIVIFTLYNFIIMAIINQLSNSNDINLKYILSVIISVGLFIVIIISVNMFNKHNQQYKGIIKSIRSIQDSLKYNFIVLDNHIKKINNNNKLLIEENQINHQLIEQAKGINEKTSAIRNGMDKLKVF